MNFNATLIGQIISFAVFWWFCAKFIWPQIIAALEARHARIADGLVAAEEGVQELADAEQRSREILQQGKQQSQSFIAQAQKRADELIEDSKETARAEGERILAAARAEIEQEKTAGARGITPTGGEPGCCRC